MIRYEEYKTDFGTVCCRAINGENPKIELSPELIKEFQKPYYTNFIKQSERMYDLLAKY